jgi:hypothetical protein
VDPLLSPNTGQYVGVISQALGQPYTKRGLSVAAVVSPLMSLVDPILPPEYGFAIIDPSGQVLFHSRSEKNGSENLFHASQDDPTLLSLVSSRKSDWVTLYYLGVKHRAYVLPLSGHFEYCPWTLVTFRDLTLLQAQLVERMTLFGILSIWYLGFMVVIAQVVPLPAYPPRWLWPSRARVGRYRHLSLALALILYAYFRLTFLVSPLAILVAAVVVPAGTITLVVFYLQAKDRWIMIGVLVVWASLLLPYEFDEWKLVSHWQKLVWASLLCGAALSLCFRSLTTVFSGRWIRPASLIGAMPSQPWRRLSNLVGPITRGKDISASYSLVALGLLLLTGALPCIGFFRIAYDHSEWEFTRRAAMTTAAAVEQRACRIGAEYDSVQFSNSNADPELERTARWLFLRRRLEKEELDRYDTVFPLPGLLRAPELPREGVPETASNTASASTWLESAMNGIAARLPVWYVPREPSTGGSPGCLSASWKPVAEGLNRLRLRLGDTEADAISPELAGLTQYFAGDSLHISQDLRANLQYLGSTPFPYGTLTGLLAGLLVLGIGVGAFCLLRATIRRLFLTDFKADEPWPEIELTADLNIDRNLILLGLPFSGKTRVFSSRADLHMIDLAAVLRGDQEIPWRISKRIVALDHFAFGCNDAESNRRKLELVERLLFRDGKIVVILTTIDPLFYVEAGTGVGARPSLDALAPGENMDRWTKALVTFTTVRIGGAAPPLGDPYYRILWSTCTKRERMVLYQLAHEGWANWKNRTILKHLVRRGLIEAGPEFRVADEDFRQFIRQWVSAEDQREWERQDETSAWDGLKVAFFVAAGLSVGAIALFYGQQVVGYVSAGVGMVGPVIKALSDLRGKTSPGGTEG